MAEVARVLGEELVERCLAGEVGVFAAVDTQLAVLDTALALKLKSPLSDSLQALLQLFQDTKAPRVRAHKLERFVHEWCARDGDERRDVQQQQPRTPMCMPTPTTVTAAASPPPMMALETPTRLARPVLYALRNDSACVRVRTKPSVELGDAVDLVDFDNNVIQVVGVTDNWFQIRLRQVHGSEEAEDALGWVVQRGAGEDLFERVREEEEEASPLSPSPVKAMPPAVVMPSRHVVEEMVPLAAFTALLHRVTQLERDLDELKRKLRAV